MTYCVSNFEHITSLYIILVFPLPTYLSAVVMETPFQWTEAKVKSDLRYKYKHTCMHTYSHTCTKTHTHTATHTGHITIIYIAYIKSSLIGVHIDVYVFYIQLHIVF